MVRPFKKIAVLYSDAKPSYFATKEAYETEKNARRDAHAVARYAQIHAQKVFPLAADSNWIKKIIKLRPDIVINLVDSVQGDDTKTPLVCATLEMLGVPFTGNGYKPIYECYDKYAVKQKLLKNNLPTPPGFLISNTNSIKVPRSLHYPLIAKLNSIHGSVGLSDINIVHNDRELKRCVLRLLHTFKTDVLVEEYIVGKEISAFIFETGVSPRVLLSEDVLKGGKDPYAIASYEFRWIEKNPVIETKKLSNAKIELIMRHAFASFEMQGYSKFDARVRDGVPYIIDVNPNPAFGPPENDSPFANVAQSLYQISFSTLLKFLLDSALANRGS